MIFGTEILGLWFANGDLFPANAYMPVWNLWIVALSWFFAFGAAFCGLIISTLITAESGRPARWLWTICGGIAMGGGVWAMHFLGMLAYDLPVTVSYDIRLTSLSWLVAVIAMSYVVRVFALPKIGIARLASASFVMAAGIGLMHYSGMAGVAGEFSMLHDPILFWISLLVALVLAVIAFTTKFTLSVQPGLPGRSLWKPISAAIIATAVSGMHYVAMTSAIFYPGTLCIATGPVIESDVLTILLMIFIILLTGLSGLSALARHAQLQTVTLRAILNHSIDAFLVIDDKGLIRSANAAIEHISGWHPDELVGFHMSVLIPHELQEQHERLMSEVVKGRRRNFMGQKRPVCLRNKNSERVAVNISVTRLPSTSATDLFVTQIHRTD